jgi:hypothetical protein
MSRLYVTSSRTRAQRAEDACSALRPSGSYEEKGCFARSYRKPAGNEDSFLRLGPDCFLAIAGTAIVDGDLGVERKEEIYELFVDGGVERVRSQILGHYAIAVKRDDEVTLFTDPLGSFPLYYTRDEESWLASNSLHACAVSCDHVSLDTSRLTTTILQSGLPADRTFYRGIRRLFGSQVIRANTADALHVDECASPTYSLPRAPTSVSDAVEQYVEQVRSVFSQIAEVGDIGVMLTGGLDSRTVLAGLLDQGGAPTVLSGTGNNSTKTSAEDHRVARTIAQKFGLDFHRMDWSDRQPHTRDELARSFQKYGFKYEVYGSPKGMIRYLKGEGKETPKVILGGYSPAFTKNNPWEREGEKVRVSNLVEEKSLKKTGEIEISGKEKYRREISKDMENNIKMRSGNNLGGEEGINDVPRALMGLRVQRDARFSNFVNEFTHYVDPFRIKRIYDPIKEMNKEVRGKRKLQIGSIKRMSRKLSDVRVYSGWERKKIEGGELRDSRPNLSMKDRLSKKYIRRKLANLVSRNTPSVVKEAVETAKKAVSAVWPQIHKDHAMRREYSERLADREVVRQCVRNVSVLPLKALARFEYFVVGAESVADTIEERSTSDSQE